MSYEERNVWAGLLVSVVAMPVYVIVIVILQQAGGGPLTQVDWVPVMLWTIGASVVVTIVLSVLWGIVAGMRDRDGVGRSDVRDRDIARMGDRVGQAFLVLGGLGAIALCAFEAHWFWIAHAVFFGFALSAIVGGVARVIAYRRGLV